MQQALSRFRQEDEFEADQWYCFQRTEDSRYLLFPENRSDELSLEICTSIPRSTNSFFLQRSNLIGGYIAPTTRFLSPWQNALYSDSLKPCTTTFDRDNPNAPYSGSCWNEGCSKRCEASTGKDPVTGETILIDCYCP